MEKRLGEAEAEIEAEWIHTHDLLQNDDGVYVLSDEKVTKIANQIEECDAIFLTFPLYVDSIPSHILRLMEAIETRRTKSKNAPLVYCGVNCGFMEAKYTKIAIYMVKLWCRSAKLTFGQAIGFGGGGMGRSLKLGHNGPGRNYDRALDEMAHNIKGGASDEIIYVKPHFPRALYIFFGNAGWKSAIKKRGLKPKDLYNRP
jgi:multimeric flavodoxin WrbA